MVWQIEDRIQNEVKREEIHVVRALKESGPAVFDYIADDAVFAIDGRVLDADSKPTLKDYMKNNYHPWATFEMKDVKVVPTGLMAATVCYRAKATKIIAKTSLQRNTLSYALLPGARKPAQIGYWSHIAKAFAEAWTKSLFPISLSMRDSRFQRTFTYQVTSFFLFRTVLSSAS
ncbi:hypothetical protein CPB85DRAFT_340080 [Mucidula mucida]|nr:hypothetical protein CPB85DRAFT_340080 [Mucidula mucida]